MASNEKLSIGPGWHISTQGYEILTQNGLIKDQKTLYQNALDSDLKEIGMQLLNTEITKNKIEELVLQIHKVRNIGAPKTNEDSQIAPRMLKLTLTDGHTFCQGIELESIPQISINKTAPGSKVLLRNAEVRSGYILLHPACCTYLGGKVVGLYEKWVISRSLLKNTRRRSSNPDGPPAWVNFGKKIVSTDDNTSFKSLNSKDGPKQDTEFENQRKDAIAEVASGAVKKVFGGGSKKFLDSQPTNQLNKHFNNREPHNKRRNETKTKLVEQTPIKPPEKVSLFNFLEDKLSDPQSAMKNESESKYQHNKPQNSFNQQQRNESRYQQNKSQNSFNQQQYNESKYQQSKLQNSFNQQQNESKYQQNKSQNSFNQQQYNESKFQQSKSQNSNYQQQQNESKYQQNKSQNTFNQQQYNESKYQQSKSQNSVNQQQQKQFNGLAHPQSNTTSEVKTSMNSQFASRSLKQHLNLDKSKVEGNVNKKNVEWKVGEQCLAKYWEDGKFYNASITNITENTLVVLFSDYGNVEEVLKSDCKKPHISGRSYRPTNKYYSRKPFAGKPESKKFSDKPA